MKWKLIQAEAPKLVYYFVTLIGLAPFGLKDNRLRPPTNAGFLYPVAVAVAHVVLTITAYNSMVSQFSKNVDELTAQIWGVTRYTVLLSPTFFTGVMILLCRKKIINLINDLCDMSNKLDTLGIEDNYAKFFNHVIVTTAVSNALVFTTFVVVYLFELHWPTFGSIEYGIASCFNLNVLLIYVQVLSCIRRRFNLLNERLFNIFSQLRQIGSSPDFQSHNQRQLIRKLQALHMELCGLEYRTTDIFTIPILLNSIQFLCLIVLSAHFICYLVSASLRPCPSGAFLSLMLKMIWPPVLRSAIAIFKVSIIVYTSVKTSQEGNSTRAVLNETWNDFHSTELEDEFFMFSVQLAQKPVTVSVFGIFNLDYSYVYKILGTMITYLIVIIQLDSGKIPFQTLDVWYEHRCGSNN